MIELAGQLKEKTVLVIGVGYTAGRSVDQMYLNNENTSIDFVLVDQDSQAIANSILPATSKICIHAEIKNKFDSSSKINSNDESLSESPTSLERVITKKYDVVFILSALDGETGTSLSVLVAQRCKQIKALVISVLSYPCYLTGKLQQFKEQSGLSDLRNQCDSVFLFSNDRSPQAMNTMGNQGTAVHSDSLFMMPVEVILNMIVLEGYINIDFKDIETLLSGSYKLAAVLSGIGKGDERIENVVTGMNESPFLAELETNSIDTILVCFESGAETEFLMNEIASVMDYLQIKFGSDAKIIWGNCSNSNLADQVRVTAIVTQSNSSKNHKNPTMKELTTLADRLNELLNIAELDLAKLQAIAHELNEIPDLRIKLIDFEQYNEENLAKLTDQKMLQIKEQNFEKAANLREQEKECLKYTNFQKYFKLKHSFFYPEERKLFYFHLGIEKNDEATKKILFG